MLVEERLRPCAHFKPEVASLNMGSMNFGLFPMLERQKEFKYDWEKPYLEGSRERIFKNTFADIEYILTTCANNGTRFEIECYDIGHLYTLKHFADRGVVKPPFFVQSVFGILGGIGPHPEDVAHMKRTADRLFGDQYQWSVLGAGRNQMSIAAMSLAMGGNVRVGMEDSLWIGPGQLARSNAEQVTKVRQIIAGLGLAVASSDEARATAAGRQAAGRAPHRPLTDLVRPKAVLARAELAGDGNGTVGFAHVGQLVGPETLEKKLDALARAAAHGRHRG